MITVTITERTPNYLRGTTSTGETAEYFAVSETWYIGSRVVRPWDAWIVVRYAL